MDSMKSHYRINVAFKNGDPPYGNYIHYFAVNIVNKRRMQNLVDDLSEKYPSPAFSVTITYWDITGKEVLKSWK